MQTRPAHINGASIKVARGDVILLDLIPQPFPL